MTVLGPPSAAALANQEYRDIAAEAGLSVVTGTGGPEKNHIAESTGTGVAVLDYDQDGLPDLYFPNAPSWDDPQGAWQARSGALYRNEGGRRFSDVTEAARLVTEIYGQGAVSADFDGDGLPDLYVTALGPNLFFRNNGDGTFSEIGERAGVADPGWSIGAVFLDADGDRTLDLFVANYIETDEPDIRDGRRTRRWRGRVPVLDGPRGLVPQANRFFRGRGNGAFEDATDSAGIGDVPARYSMGAVALDFDDDGDQDIFVANDSGPNDMLENRGGLFRDAGLFTGVALSADGATQGSMGVAAADADEDGWPDLVVTNFAHDHYAFYQGVGPSLFFEDAVGAGMATATFRPLGWGALFFDADNDGDLDVAFANGHLYPQVEDDPALGETYGQPDQLFLRNGGTYGAKTLGTPVRSSRGMALIDIEGDGRWEIAVANQDDVPTLWARDSPAGGAWIRFRLADPEGERDALGARVTLVSPRQSRSVRAGESYASDSERILHFGLESPGDSEAQSVEIEIRWPDGSTEQQGVLTARRTWLLRRGSAPVALPPP
ncbi:MAG: CRTAC1 family protein [Acidobacteriota bacterium]|nr:CRTAC1 family protein [Acidobacteriota bacterium]